MVTPGPLTGAARGEERVQPLVRCLDAAGDEVEERAVETTHEGGLMRLRHRSRVALPKPDAPRR